MPGSGGEYITRYEADKLMTEMLRDYEAKIVNPRHAETQGSIAEVKNLIQQATGMGKLAGFLGSCAAVFWIVMQIVHAVNQK